MPNIEELRLTLKEIEHDPAMWDQAEWLCETECGTVGCFAGRTVLRHGWVLANGWHGCCIQAGGDHIRAVSEVAAEILELSTAQWQELFDASNNLPDLRLLVNQYCDD